MLFFIRKHGDFLKTLSLPVKAHPDLNKKVIIS